MICFGFGERWRTFQEVSTRRGDIEPWSGSVLPTPQSINETPRLATRASSSTLRDAAVLHSEVEGGSRIFVNRLCIHIPTCLFLIFSGFRLSPGLKSFQRPCCAITRTKATYFYALGGGTHDFLTRGKSENLQNSARGPCFHCDLSAVPSLPFSELVNRHAFLATSLAILIFGHFLRKPNNSGVTCCVIRGIAYSCTAH